MPALTPQIARPRLPRARLAFTLIELLTVIAIIGILAGILIPVVGKVRQSARAATCVSNLRQIGGAIQAFATDNKGLFPGGGKRSAGGSSASWQDTLNVMVFEANLTSPRPPLQRYGDTPIQGQIYCPSIEPWGTTARYPRAYVINSNTGDSNPITNPPVPTWGPMFDYQKGKPLSLFQNPSRTVLILESEREGDGIGASVPYDQMVMGDGTATPTWVANGVAFSFRHNNRMNVLFMDCHVEAMSPDQAAKINNIASFSPAGP